ncbi:MAG: IS3 family transposase [Proteobacteria bacterium]|nr:IS3 family transposase [Pseudomonadota bacterium]
MRYQFIDAHKKTWPIRLMCKVMNVSSSGYYNWRRRPVCAQELSNRKLDAGIREVYSEHKQRYGVPRVTEELNDRGFQCSANRVARRMQKLGLKGIQAKKFKRTTDSNHDKPVAPDLIEQDFTALAPNQKWVSDLTYVWTDEGWLYLAVIMDLYSRAIIGWSMGKRMTQQLMCDALTMALFRRGFPKGVIIHSDRGSQYCSKAYQKLIKMTGLRCSMGRRATCYDNAAMESFFHTLKVELIHRERYLTRQEAKGAIFEYIETYYNRKRRHSAIGYKIPMLFEQKSA